MDSIQGPILDLLGYDESKPEKYQKINRSATPGGPSQPKAWFNAAWAACPAALASIPVASVSWSLSQIGSKHKPLFLVCQDVMAAMPLQDVVRKAEGIAFVEVEFFDQAVIPPHCSLLQLQQGGLSFPRDILKDVFQT